jgi:hypothetical protein
MTIHLPSVVLLVLVVVTSHSSRTYVPHHHVESLHHENLFHVKYRMSLDSFNKLLNLLCPTMQLNDKYAAMTGMEPICCEIMLHCTIRFLLGGSYHDIHATVSISKPSFYHLVWHTIDCINKLEALDVQLPSIDQLNSIRDGFKRISTDGVMNGCVGSLDGYLLRITAPSFAECRNVTAYFSGHYCTYGVNVQAMCDADCHFLSSLLLHLGKLMILLLCVRLPFLLGSNHCLQDFLLQLTVLIQLQNIWLHLILAHNGILSGVTTSTSSFHRYASGLKWLSVSL